MKTPHIMKKLFKRLPWLVCASCGFVALNNEASHKRMREGCDKYED